jgi:hypothetical protein
MGRKDESLLNLLVECPWWVSVLLSGMAYLFLKFIFPSITFHGMAANAFTKGLSDAAPLVSLVLLLPAPIVALNSWLKNKRRDDRQAFEQIPMEIPPVSQCPRCGSELVIKAAKKGSNPGEKFWGCSRFPQCRFTKPFRNGR